MSEETGKKENPNSQPEKGTEKTLEEVKFDFGTGIKPEEGFTFDFGKTGDFKFDFGNDSSTSGFKFEFDKAGEFNTEEKKNKTPKYIEELTEEQKKSLEDLKQVQSDLDKLNKEYEKELKQLDEKYSKLKSPLFEKRKEIIHRKDDNKFTGIPNFWLHVIKNSEIFEEMFQKKDVDTLKYLEDIKVINFEDGGFKIEFHYKENPYFENKVLTKTYKVKKEGDDEELIPEGCEIQWKEGKNLTVKVVTKKQRHKSGGKVRTVKKEVPCDSFYNFFKPLKAPEVEDDEEEGEEEFEALLDADIELGQLIADRIVPNAINYYLNEPDEEAISDALQRVTIEDDEDDDE